MKKIFFAVVLAYVINIPSSSFAAINLPESVSIGSSTVYDAGKLVNLQVTQGTKSIDKQTLIEYGIARTVKNGQFISFEILTTNTSDIAGYENMPILQLSIPNLLPENATSTYVAYIKYFEKNNPDNESFHISNEFSIQLNQTPFAQVKNINFLQSNGKRFDTLEGPTIYSVEDALKYSAEKLATSTSLEITFESNQAFVIQPKIVFSKIRSGAFVQEFTPKPITIKKGTTYVVIPLPVFEYDPGVYMGQLVFDTPLLQNKVDLQYIVGGDAVSVGTVSVVKGPKVDSFKFDIFGTPIDIDRVANQATSTLGASTTPQSLIYTVQTQILDANGVVVQESSQSVDFNQQQDFSVEILKKRFDQVQVSSVKITVTSPTTGKVIFEGVKDIEYIGEPEMHVKRIIYIILWILFTILTLAALLKRRVKMVVVFVLALIVLFISRKAFALYSLESYLTSFDATYFRVEKFSEVPRLFVQENLPDRTYACGSSIPLTFKIQYLRCSNSSANVSVGFSWVSSNAADNSRAIVSRTTSSDTHLATASGHNFYRTLSSFVTTRIPAPSSRNSPVNLYAVVRNSNSGPVDAGYSKYTIPVQTTCQPKPTTCNCSGRTQVCTRDGVRVSQTANSPACSLQASCSVNVSGDQATFTTVVTHALGNLSYKDTDTNAVISNPVTRTIPAGGSVTQRTTVTDLFDNMTAQSSCSSIPSPSDTITPSDDTTVDIGDDEQEVSISDFGLDKSIVEEGKECKFRWRTTGVSLCTFKVNGEDFTPAPDGKVGTNILVGTADGNNKFGVLTCISSTTPAYEISTSTTCRVNPKVRQQ